MSREILYRGKRVDNGEWVEGLPVPYESGGYCIFAKPFSKYGYEANEICKRLLVIPETVGEYTNLVDKNGKKIFEGDICKVCYDVDIDVIEIGVIYYEDRFCAWGVRYNKHKCNLLFDIFTSEDENVWIEVIDNIHDTPELLEVVE